MKNRLFLLIFFVGMFFSTFAQNEKQSDFNLSAGVDLASSYLWRGIPQGTGPAIQPWGEFSYKGFTLGTWGSSEFSGNFKEIDLYAKYTYRDFSLQFVDLFFPEYVGLNQNYFNFRNATTGHASEIALSFNGSEKIPFSLYGGVILYGTAIDPKATNSSAINHSAYFEINYLGKFNEFNYNLFAGFTPAESVLYGTKGFSVFNVGVSAKKSIKITADFSLPLKLTLATNPESKKTFLSLLISI